MKISLIILNYNTPELVYDCLKSLAYLEIPAEIILVDNGSNQKLDPGQLKSFPSVRYFSLPENKGFGGGNNFGAKQASGDYLWFLNSDTLLPDPSINQAFHFLAQHPEIGILSPLLYNDRACTQLQPDFYARFQSLPSVIFRSPRPALALDQEYQETEVVVGASLIMPTTVFKQVGGFDEQIFMFMEDDDLCLRVKQAGFKVVIFCKSQIIHLQGKSISVSSKRKKLYYKAQNYYWQKHFGRLPLLVMRLLRFPYKVWKTHSLF